VNIAGVTVTDGGFKVDSAINFYNSGGSVSSSTIGAMTGTGLGWGVAATNGYSVSPAGAFSRTVSLTGDKIFGYGAGGVLADGAKAATPTTASGVATTVNVSASTITGTADVARASQSGVQINAGARSLIQSSAISNNQASDPRNGVGVLLTNADTLGNSAIPPAVPTTSQFFTRIGSNNFSGDGYGIFNADATNTGVRLGAPVQITTGGTGATGNYFGSAAGPLVGSPSAAGQEGISGPDSTPAPSFTPSTGTYFATTPRTIAATPAGITDASPTVSWGSPSADDSFFTEEDNDVLVLAGDDFGVTKVDVTIDGVPQPSLTLSPYELTYTPSAAQAGTTVHISATATDSAGHTSTSDLDVPVIERPVTPPPPPPPPPGSGSAGAGATTPKTTCKKHKKKHHKKKKKKKKKCKK
jgi:hypothetical protein